MAADVRATDRNNRGECEQAANVQPLTMEAVWVSHPTAILALHVYGHLMGTAAERAAVERVNAAFGNLTGTSKPLRVISIVSDGGSPSR